MDAERTAETLSKTQDIVELNRKRLAREMADADPEYSDPQHVKLALDLARASVELSKEMRAWAKQHREMGKKLTLAERIELTVAFIKKLHATDRREFLAAIGARDGE